MVGLSTKEKWRFYKTAVKQFETGKFSRMAIQPGMYEPCMRLIARDLCYSYNYKQEYNDICNQMKQKKTKRIIHLSEEDKKAFLNITKPQTKE
jgi:hypothetical protein